MGKTKYQSYVLPRLQSVREWVLEGLDEKQIAQRLGIGCQTFKKYKREHTEFASCLEANKDSILDEVERALLKKARGYTYTETKTVDKGDKVEETVTEKEMPPDMSAISFFLKNYCPEKWGDKSCDREERKEGGVVILPQVLEKEDEDESI